MSTMISATLEQLASKTSIHVVLTGSNLLLPKFTAANFGRGTLLIISLSFEPSVSLS